MSDWILESEVMSVKVDPKRCRGASPFHGASPALLASSRGGSGKPSGFLQLQSLYDVLLL